MVKTSRPWRRTTPDFAVEIRVSLSCSHGGVTYGSGETAVVPAAVARFWVRSGWATTATDDAEDETDAGDEATEDAPRTSSVAAPVKTLSPAATAAGGGRRKS